MLYTTLQVLVRVVVWLFFRVEVIGRENIPEGGCLVVSNHLSWTDTIFIMYALPRTPRLHTMANESSVFNTRFKRWLMPRVAVFPIRRNRGMLDEAAVNHVYDLLQAGERVLIFPEGAYGKDGQLRPLKDGVGYFALNSQRPLLPVVLRGTGRLRPFSRVTVDIGKPFIPDPPRFLELKLRVRAAVATVRNALGRAGIMGERRRGQRRQRERRRWASRWSRRPRRWRRWWFLSARDSAQPGGVVAGEAHVEHGQPAADDQQPDQGATGGT